MVPSSALLRKEPPRSVSKFLLRVNQPRNLSKVLLRVSRRVIINASNKID